MPLQWVPINCHYADSPNDLVCVCVEVLVCLTHFSVEDCLVAKSGLPFIRSGRLRSVARSSGFSGSPVEVEASKCKIDTILCNLKEADSARATSAAASAGCRERTLRCLPLLDDAQGTI